MSRILFTGGMPAPGGGCLLLGVGCLLWVGCLLPGGCLVPGGAWSWGVSALGGACAQGGVCSRGTCYRGGAWWRPPTPGTATAAGGAHPTGMHSCLTIDLFLNKNYIHTIRSYSRDCTNRIKDSCFELSLT